jgi:GAF domain-containing protein
VIRQVQRFAQQLTTPIIQSNSRVEVQRARLLLGIGLLTTAGGLGFLLFVFIPSLVNGQPIAVFTSFYNLALIPVGLTLFALTRFGRSDLAVFVFIGGLLALTQPLLIIDPRSPLIFSAFPLIGAAVLLNRFGIVLVASVVLGVLGVRLSINAADRVPVRVIPAETVPAELFTGLTVIVAGTGLLLLSGGGSSRIAEEGEREVDHVQRGFELLSQAAYSDQELYARTLYMLERDLGYREAQIYQTEENGRIVRRYRLNETARARESTMQPLELLIIDENVASEPAVEAGRTATRVISLRDGEVYSSHLKGDAQAAFLTPIASGERAVGVLSVQSDDRTGFTLTIRRALETLAVSLAYRVNRLRDYGELLRTYKTQEEALLQARAQLSQLRERGAGGVLTRATGRRIIGFDALAERLNAAGGEPGLSRFRAQPVHELSSDIRETLERGALHTEILSGGEKQLRVPIAVRGEVFGAMTFTLDADAVLSERQLELVRAVANRLALTLENSELVERTQAQAARERKATQIASELLAVTDIDALLTLATASFREALGAVYTGVYLAPDQVTVRTADLPPLPADSTAARKTGPLKTGPLAYRPPTPGSEVGGNGHHGTNGSAGSGSTGPGSAGSSGDER